MLWLRLLPMVWLAFGAAGIALLLQELGEDDQVTLKDATVLAFVFLSGCLGFLIAVSVVGDNIVLRGKKRTKK